MMGKQAFVDLLIVLAIPLAIIGAYFFWFRGNDTTPLLSPSAWQDKNEVAESQPGAKAERALKMLRTIHLDDSLFKDPAYLSLKTYTVNIPSVPVSRPFPFTPPPAVLELLKESRRSSGKAASLVSASSKIDASSAAAKINMIKVGR